VTLVRNWAENKSWRAAVASTARHGVSNGCARAKRVDWEFRTIRTTKGGHRLATAVGGAVAGFRAELTIIDDPMQPDEVASELKKQGLRDWYSGVVEQRLVPGGAMIVVMHRLAPDDFTATLLEKGGWFHIALPLIAVEQITYTYRSGRDSWTRKPGDLLSPGWTTPQAVEDIRRNLLRANSKSVTQGVDRRTRQRHGAL
jgi:hypothetical protein